jgi:LmbE family N-acetylglucosaminyl deacetylase
MSRLTLMAIFAHPDDEAFGLGGTLSLYAAEGHDVYLVTATRGEAGQIADPSLGSTANLPLIREHELRCACQVYGIHEPIFLDYVDGQLPIVHQGQAVGKIVRILREIRPDVVITFGPDGIYGHYDHIAIHRWTIIAVDLAAETDCFPEQLVDSCRPHQVRKVYLRALPETQVAAMSDGDKPAAVMMDGVPFAFHGRPPEEITTVIDVGDYVDQKLRGIRCHVTQIGQDSPYDRAPDRIVRQPWFQSECFVLAKSTIGRPEDLETDLLTGLR